jgi:hypothetical protein
MEHKYAALINWRPCELLVEGWERHVCLCLIRANKKTVRATVGSHMQIEVAIGSGSASGGSGKFDQKKLLGHGSGSGQSDSDRVGFWVEHCQIFSDFGFLVAHVMSGFGSLGSGSGRV